jgi:UDP-N-acetyl-D-mannosaminuronic acid transferase (WecB/TagA/CpsF family)
MKLQEIHFSEKELSNFWKDWSFDGAAMILPMHAEKWYLSQKQGDWDEILKEVDIFVADGVGLAWGYRFLTGKKVNKISGIDLIERLVIITRNPNLYLGDNPREHRASGRKLQKKRLKPSWLPRWLFGKRRRNLS